MHYSSTTTLGEEGGWRGRLNLKCLRPFTECDNVCTKRLLLGDCCPHRSPLSQPLCFSRCRVINSLESLNFPNCFFRLFALQHDIWRLTSVSCVILQNSALCVIRNLDSLEKKTRSAAQKLTFLTFIPGKKVMRARRRSHSFSHPSHLPSLARSQRWIMQRQRPLSPPITAHCSFSS